MTASHERFLVTGALGCIGAWAVKLLVDDGATVVTFDKGDDAKRLRLVMGEDGPSRVTRINSDITDADAIARALDDHDITNVIHLAALQLPFARANPPLGALVNVVGTVNLFEAVKARRDRIGPIVYAGSVAMYSSGDAVDGRLSEDAVPHPGSHYGVYKLANEGTARIYATDDGVGSVGLRPLAIYGPGRDQGLTSDPSRSILSAMLGRPFEIGFGGSTTLQFAPDVAHAFISAARSSTTDARVYNLDGSRVSIDAFIETLDRVVPGAAELVTHKQQALAFPDDIGVTPLEDAIAASVALYRERLEAGQLDPAEHGLTA
jgi:UDP-glucuronate 4-epimerase